MVILVASVMLSTAYAWSQEACTLLSSKDKDAITTYVKHKYKLPAATQVTITFEPQPIYGCYRKLHISSSDPIRPLSAHFYLSPDHNLLVTGLLDVHADPLQEEQIENMSRMVELTRGNFPQIGSPNPAVTIVEFADFQCPFCERADEILKEFFAGPEAADVRLVFRHFPLGFHKWAQTAAEATACVQLQDRTKFWALHDWIFHNQQNFTSENAREQLTTIAEGLKGINRQRFESCMASSGAAELLRTDREAAAAVDVQGTPTFFLNGKRMVGIRSLDDLKASIEQARIAQSREVAARDSTSSKPQK
jgi:protein-disulfide isomerase